MNSVQYLHGKHPQSELKHGSPVPESSFARFIEAGRSEIHRPEIMDGSANPQLSTSDLPMFSHRADHLAEAIQDNVCSLLDLIIPPSSGTLGIKYERPPYMSSSSFYALSFTEREQMRFCYRIERMIRQSPANRKRSRANDITIEHFELQTTRPAWSPALESQKVGLAKYRNLQNQENRNPESLSVFQEYFDAFDKLFFGERLRNLCALRLTSVGDDCDILGECHSSGVGDFAEIPDNIACLIDITDLRTKNPELEASKRFSVYLGTLVHEMVHAYFAIYTCNCRSPQCEENAAQLLGGWGHQSAWQDVAFAIEVAAVQLCGGGLDLGRADGLENDQESAEKCLLDASQLVLWLQSSNDYAPKQTERYAGLRSRTSGSRFGNDGFDSNADGNNDRKGVCCGYQRGKGTF